jgi:hypothetical protein
MFFDNFAQAAGLVVANGAERTILFHHVFKLVFSNLLKRDLNHCDNETI